MYTVLIQSKKTMDSLQQFRPILQDAETEGHIGICQWVEAGDTIETAVPELYELVNHKQMWKAIIVSIEYDDQDSDYPATTINPFDYLENKSRNGITIENDTLVDCAAPLIRLTHLLGGIPAPEPEFEARVIEEDNRLPKIEYHPVNSEETKRQKKIYLDWMDSHKFQGLPPAEIILVKVRKPPTSGDSLAIVRSSWVVHTESDSSTFWKRNLYPNNCRFLVYDMDQRGVLRRQEDLFKLWMSILLIAENDIDPDVLQAHRLYNLGVRFNEEALAEVFQQTVNKLNMAKYQIEKGIERDNARQEHIPNDPPDFYINVPVSFQFPKASAMHFDGKDYKLTGGADSSDVEQWNCYAQQSAAELQDLIRNAERTLDHVVSRMRENTVYTESEVNLLNTYQQEDMSDALDDLYKDLLVDQGALPSKISDVREELEGKKKEMCREVADRISHRQAMGAILTASGAVVLCMVPCVFFGATRLSSLAAMLTAGGLVCAAGLLVLVSQKSTFVKKAKQYQKCMQNIVSELSHNSSVYSNFLTEVASHIHGRNYLDIMTRKSRKRGSTYFFLMKHLKSIELLMSQIDLWSTAMHIQLDMHSVDAIELMDDDKNEVEYDKLYSLKHLEHQVPLNATGVYINSPYSFVERLNIEREEAYDDVNNR